MHNTDSSIDDNGSMNLTGLKDGCTRFLLHRHMQDLVSLLQKPATNEHYSLRFNILALVSFDVTLAEALCEQPTEILLLFDKAALIAQQQIMQREHSQTVLAVKQLVHVRVLGVPFHLDPQSSLYPSIGNIRSCHVDKLITVTGTVVRTACVTMIESHKLYQCARCYARVLVPINPDTAEASPPAGPCQTQQGPRMCNSSKFKASTSTLLHTNYQEIKIQEDSKTLPMGSVPRSISVLLQDDLADTCQTGDDIEVTGIVTRQWLYTMPGVRCNTEIMLTANNVFKQNHHQPQLEAGLQAVQLFSNFWQDHADCPLLGRNLLLQHVCPQLQGLCMVKLALMLMLVGGEQQVSKTGQSRAELHMLLVGDPGTGKSQLMQYAAKLSPHGVISSGRGSSSAGLTVTAIKDGGQWALEAGALILSDGGVCCIDEFDGIKEADKVSIHEVMEQQTLSIAKAGLVTSLSTRTSVFGAMNPRGNPKDSLAEQTLLSGPLLSRFDILLPVHDSKSSEADEVISEHILINHQLHRSSETKSWDMKTMQQYLLWVKATFHPELSSEAEEVLTGYYKLQRSVVDRTSSRTTVRMLESLVRSAQAHAKLMARQQVTLQDAVIAVSIAEAASKVLGNGSEFNVGASFCAQPDAAYDDESQYLLQAIRHLHSDSE